MTVDELEEFWAALGWTCDCCRTKRPDKFINVYKHQIPFGFRNVKYCNDKFECLERAKERKLFVPKEFLGE